MNPTTEIAVRPNGSVANVRQEFGATEISTQHETAAAAVAAREQAAVQARYIVAERRPRNIEQFRVSLEGECRRPGFAEKVKYSKPAGKAFKNGRWVENYAEGPTIRFIEAALRCFGNVYPEVTTVFDNSQLRICRVSVTDLETNVSYTSEVPIPKAVERKGKQNKQTGEWTPPEGREILGQRINSYGDPTYLVVATDDEVLMKQNALLSKAIRTNAQRLLPWDIVERCMEIAAETLKNADAKDPDAGKRRLVDAFAQLGVQPVDIEAYLGHSLNRPLVPQEIEALRGIYTAVKEGESSWEDIMAAKSDTGSEDLLDEVRARKLAEAKAFQDQQQRKDTPADTATTVSTEPRDEAPTTTASDKPATEKPKFQFGGKK